MGGAVSGLPVLLVRDCLVLPTRLCRRGMDPEVHGLHGRPTLTELCKVLRNHACSQLAPERRRLRLAPHKPAIVIAFSVTPSQDGSSSLNEMKPSQDGGMSQAVLFSFLEQSARNVQ